MSKLGGSWSTESFNNTEADALLEIINCFTGSKGDMSW